MNMTIFMLVLTIVSNLALGIVLYNGPQWVDILCGIIGLLSWIAFFYARSEWKFLRRVMVDFKYRIESLERNK